MRQSYIGVQVREPIYVESMIKATNQAIAHAVINCKLSISLLNTKQWHKMVQAIACIGPYFPND